MAEDRGSQAAGAAGLFLALSWIFVSLRCYCKIAIVRVFGREDYLCVITQILFTLYCAVVILGVHYGTGRHAVDIIPQSNIPIGLKWWWFGEQLYSLTSLTLKFSIGLFLLRLAVYKSQRIILWAVMAVSALMCTYLFLLFIFQCRPIAYFWGQYTGMKGSCIDPWIVSRSVYAYSAISCWADWTFCILPGFMVWNVQMNPRMKASVLVLFSLGAVASTTTIIRFPYLRTMTNKADFLYATTNVGILSTSEIGIGIITSAAATLRPLCRRFLGRTQLGSTPVELSHQWPSNPTRAGYSRNREGGHSRADEEHIGIATEIRTQRRSTQRLENARREVGVGNVAGRSITHPTGKWHAGESEDTSIEDNRPTSTWEAGFDKSDICADN